MASNENLLLWGIQDTTKSAGHRHGRTGGHWGVFWTGLLCGAALTSMVTIFI